MKTPEQWAAFCSGTRLEILSALDGLGEASVADIAFAIDRSADGLYRHVHLLEEAGLIQEVSIRRVGRQTESVYRTAAEQSVVDIDLTDADARGRILDVFRMVQRESRRTFGAAVDAGLGRVGEADRNTWVRLSQAWLDEDDVRELGRKLDELDAFFRDRQARRPGALHQCAVAVSPVHRDRPFTARGSQRQEAMVADVEQAPSHDGSAEDA